MPLVKEQLQLDAFLAILIIFLRESTKTNTFVCSQTLNNTFGQLVFLIAFSKAVADVFLRQTRSAKLK
jgi:hypothetical protein